MAKEKILIVDDETDVLDLCKRILETQGYNVISTNNGYEAIEYAHTENFDLLLTDIKMPGLNGLEIAQMLKDYDPGIICVTMTGFSTMDMAINALKLGIDEFILKPFTPKELSHAVSKALEKERLRKENVRLRSLIPLFELNKTLLGTVEVNKVLTRLLEISQEETKASLGNLYVTESGKVFLFSDHSETLSWTDEQKQICNKLVQSTFDNGKLLTLNQDDVNETQPEILNQLGVASIIAIPLQAKKVSLGVLFLARKETPFAPSDIEFLSVLSSQAGIALENARLFSEIQDAYDQLRSLDHMKSEFINIAAHELRTPLAILVGYVSVLEEEVDAPYKEFVSNVMRNAMRLRSLIDDMLNLKYLESGIALLVPEELNLSEAVHEITQDVSLLAQKKQLDININIPSDFPEIIADRQKFDLILVNLMHNAVKFTPTGGKITFSSEVNGNKALMSIHNTGTIIPEKKIHRIFERFYQIESSLTREHGGAGLGLAIVRGMTEVCGGEVFVKSNKEHGTTFSFTLPLDNTNLKARKLEL